MILPILPNDSNVFGRTPLLLRVTVYWSFTGGLEVDNGVRVCGKVGEIAEARVGIGRFKRRFRAKNARFYR